MEPDLGGNHVKVRYLGAETNLHSVWDSMLIEWGSGDGRRLRLPPADLRAARPAIVRAADRHRESTGSTNRITRP